MNEWIFSLVDQKETSRIRVDACDVKVEGNAILCYGRSGDLTHVFPLNKYRALRKA